MIKNKGVNKIYQPVKLGSVDCTVVFDQPVAQNLHTAVFEPGTAWSMENRNECLEFS